MIGRVLLCVALALGPLARPLLGQAASARLFVTVVDPSGGALPGATVTLVGLEDATRKATIPPAPASDKGLATFEAMATGRYSIQAQFPGFELGLLRNVTIRRGDNRHVVVLVLKAIKEDVTIGGGQETASSRAASSFGLSLTREDVDTLSDDPNELRQQIEELAGPDAIIRVDSFEGAQLPMKSQIKSIHVTRDQFAAEAQNPGSTFVDIITQPGIGRLSGSGSLSYRPNALAGVSPFVQLRAPASSQNYSGSIGGTILKNRSDFSLGVYGQSSYTTPILRQVGAPARVLDVRQPSDYISVNGLFNYALTRDQTVRLGYANYRQHSRNQGIGQYDSPERAASGDYSGYQFRVQEAGPIGRRTFQNTRLFLSSIDQSQHSAVEQQTIVIQDARTIGGAQVGGGTRQTAFNFASDVDYISGIHSWRAGVQIDGGWYDSNASSGYLGTYTFADEAAFAAGRPLLYTQTIGDPRVKYFNAQTAVYLQDDLRISKTLTISPGVRYMVQTHVRDRGGVAPRFGLTWSPFASGRTAFRFSAGLFYWPLEMSRVYEQTLRYDGNHQQEVIVVNPAYPDPGVVEGLPPNKYVLGDYTLQRNLRYSVGVDHRLSPRVRLNVLWAYVHQFELWRGLNLNAPIDGTRPDPAFANVVEAITDGVTRRHDVTANLNISMLAASPAANAARVNWRRISMSLSVGAVHGRNNSDGPFSPPPTGSLADQWGPMAADQPYRVTLSLTSTQIRNLNLNVSWSDSAGLPYTWTTGVDDNLDGILNDRPSGVPLRSLRGSAQSTLSLRASYALVSPAGGGPAGGRRYRVMLTASVSNLTNRSNYGGYSGNQTSPDFMQPTYVTNPRRVDTGVTVAF